MSNTSATIAESLTLAVIASSTAPLLLLDGSLTIIAASTSFGTTFGLASANVAGRTIAELGSGLID